MKLEVIAIDENGRIWHLPIPPEELAELIEDAHLASTGECQYLPPFLHPTIREEENGN